MPFSLGVTSQFHSLGVLSVNANSFSQDANGRTLYLKHSSLDLIPIPSGESSRHVPSARDYELACRRTLGGYYGLTPFGKIMKQLV